MLLLILDHVYVVFDFDQLRDVVRLLAHLRPASADHLDRAEHSDKHSRGHTHHLGRLAFPRETPSSKKQTTLFYSTHTLLFNYYSFRPQRYTFKNPIC